MGTVRITSGRLRGRRVATPTGEQTRPLLTRVRKSLVDLLRPRLPGARVLDLFGGSGAIALELLSNGADSALVVELDPKTADLILHNSASLGVEGQVQVRVGDAVATAHRLAAEGETFDVVVVAPPYGQGFQQRVLATLEDHPILAPGGVVVVQREAREPPAEPGQRLRRLSTRAYGRTVFDFYGCE